MTLIYDFKGKWSKECTKVEEDIFSGVHRPVVTADYEEA
jgi:hypothetical protein